MRLPWHTTSFFLKISLPSPEIHFHGFRNSVDRILATDAQPGHAVESHPHIPTKPHVKVSLHTNRHWGSRVSVSRKQRSNGGITNSAEPRVTLSAASDGLLTSAGKRDRWVSECYCVAFVPSSFQQHERDCQVSLFVAQPNRQLCIRQFFRGSIYCFQSSIYQITD